MFFAQKTRGGEGRLEVGGGWKGDATEPSYKFPISHAKSPVFAPFLQNLRPLIWFKGPILSHFLPNL